MAGELEKFFKNTFIKRMEMVKSRIKKYTYRKEMYYHDPFHVINIIIILHIFVYLNGRAGFCENYAPFGYILHRLIRFSVCSFISIHFSSLFLFAMLWKISKSMCANRIVDGMICVQFIF